MTEEIITILGIIFASQGFWTLLQGFFDSRRKKRVIDQDDFKALKTQVNNLSELMIGDIHERIVHLGAQYLVRGWCTQAEYDGLKLIYDPYENCGGNGSAKTTMHALEVLMEDGHISQDTKRVFK